MNYRIPKLNTSTRVCKEIIEELCIQIVQPKLVLVDLKFETFKRPLTLCTDTLVKKRVISLENKIFEEKVLLTSNKRKLEEKQLKLHSQETRINFLVQKRDELRKKLNIEINKVRLELFSFA